MAPARAVLDRIRLGIGWRTEIDVMATTRPNRWARMPGTASWHMATTDRRFRASAGV